MKRELLQKISVWNVRKAERTRIYVEQDKNLDNYALKKSLQKKINLGSI